MEELVQQEELSAKQLEERLSKLRRDNKERNKQFAAAQNASHQDDGSASDSPRRKSSKKDKKIKKKKEDSDTSEDEDELRVFNNFRSHCNANNRHV